MSHNERCKECKVSVRQLLEKIYGPVIPNYRIQIGTRPEELREHPRFSVLKDIYFALQNHRGFTEFVRAAYIDVDFFLPEQGMIVEFDESQHFSELRKIALSQYPSDLNLGFPRDTWMKHCDEIRAYDNDPPFRDEQRAWYDTLRDFIPELKGFRPTVRLFARDMAWCSLDAEKPEDVAKFRALLETVNDIDVQIQTDKSPTIARVIIAGHWKGDVAKARDVLETVADKWGSNPPTEFLQTPGAFIRFGWPDTYPSVGNVTYPNPDTVESLMRAAERDIDAALAPQLRTKLAEHAKYLTFGADSNNESYQIEFVCIINLRTNERVWTGKSYPNSEQEDQLIRIQNLESHFPVINNRRVLVLGCHDLHIFNNRWDSREDLLSPWRIETRSEMNRLSQIYQPSLVLQHPHSTDSCGTWRQGWSGLLEKISSVKVFSSDGLYYHDGEPCRNSLQEILQSSKQGETLDFIFHFEKALPEQRNALPSKTAIKNTPERSAPQGYRARFYEIVEAYEHMTPKNFRRPHGTKMKRNLDVKTVDLPKDVHYEFTDWNDKISIELSLRRTILPYLEPVFLGLSKKRFQNLPVPQQLPVKDGWQRLLFYFSEEVPTIDIMNAMNSLIEQTYPELQEAVQAHTSTANSEIEKTNIGGPAPNEFYEKIRRKLDVFFGKSVIDQKTKYTYRAENEIGYPNKTELDMISLFKPNINAPDQVRFHIYPHVLSDFTRTQNANEIVHSLPEGSVIKQDRKNLHPGDIFIEGVFSTEEEIEKFVKWILFGNDRILQEED